MKTLVDAVFREEVRRFELRFTCEDCAHYDGDAARCSHGYPVKPHRSRCLAQVAECVFCKEFELL